MFRMAVALGVRVVALLALLPAAVFANAGPPLPWREPVPLQVSLVALLFLLSAGVSLSGWWVLCRVERVARRLEMLPQTLGSLDWFLAIYIGPAVMALGLTLVIEIAVALVMGWRSGHDLVGVAAVSVMTNPFFVLSVYVLLLVFRSIAPLPLVLFITVLEVVIVVVEWRLLRWALKKDSRRTALLSTVMNGASFVAGLILVVVKAGAPGA